MTVDPARERYPLRTSDDLARMRKALGRRLDARGVASGLQTRIVTAATELGRNVIRHGAGGWMCFGDIEADGRRGLSLEFEDEGPGIADVERAWKDGFSTAGGLGLGLGGSRRLIGELEVEPRQPRGVRVTGTAWLDRPRPAR
jgi:serine/threonine-protein kinase RsbT